MEIGDIINIKIKLDDISFDQTLTITYIINDLILTCGHCLPSNALIDNGKILYTSGFDTIDEGLELGIIQMNYKLNNSEYKLLKKINFRKINNIKLIHQKNKYSLINLHIYDSLKFKNLEMNKLNRIDKTEFYFMHGINKLISNKNILHDVFNLDNIGLAYSEEKYKSINTELMTINKIAENYNLTIKTDKIYYLTEPSYSGSPIIYNNYLIGYHVGSTLGFIIKLNCIVWIGKIIYYKLLLVK